MPYEKGMDLNKDPRLIRHYYTPPNGWRSRFDGPYPVANPDNTRNSAEVPSIEVTSEAVPVSAAIPHAPAATTTVRSAVATVELVDATPAFVRMAVSPANRADRQAARIHIRPGYVRS